MTPCKMQITETLRIFHEQGDVIEIRIIGVPGRGRPHTAAGYFNDFDAAGEAVLKYELLKPTGIYFVLNQVNPELFSRSPNQITNFLTPTTSDSDILRRRWLLIDVDPDRPAGISSTDQQFNAARAKADQVDDWLHAEMFFPEPIITSSGNGTHLLYPIDLPNDKGSEATCKAVLKSLQHRFGDDQCSVDLGVFNAARITKLYGTTARKGHATEERPHRQSRILFVPEYIRSNTEALRV